MEYIKLLSKKYDDWKERRFLKKHGCETRAQYEYIYDPDCNRDGRTIKEYFHGYPYIYSTEDSSMDVIIYNTKDGELYGRICEIDQWCRENCKSKFRIDGLRVKNQYITPSHDYDYYFPSGQSIGTYKVFVAFKSEEELIWFTLRWDGATK